MSLNIQRRPAVELPFEHNLHPCIAKIYASRGVTSANELSLSLSELIPVTLLTDADKAANILADAIQHQKKIIIVGDFDADGATSTAVCLLALKKMGAHNVTYLVPNRFDFGYGLSPQIVDIAKQNNAEVIVTVDNGIACFDGVNRAKELGIQVVITDHHLPAETLPNANVIVNPNRRDCLFASKAIAGVGVAFYLMLALRAELKNRGWFEQQQIPVFNLAELLDLVALGTVADVVPLDFNNRILVHQGLQRIRAGKCRPGILQLLKQAGRNEQKLVATDLGFVVAPRLNAAGRLDDMSLGIECLTVEDEQIAMEMATQLDMLNRERRHIESGMKQQAEQSVSQITLEQQQLPKGICLYQSDWHQGVIGIVAGRIKDKFHRPTIAFAAANDDQDCDELKGSARSISGLHIRDLLDELDKRNPDLIIKFGGHAMAAGLSIKTDNFRAFESEFTSLVDERVDDKILAKVMVSDGELDTSELNLQFAAELKHAGPWGQQFQEPLFDAEFAIFHQKVVAEKHLKLMLQTDDGELIDAIAFNAAGDEWPNQNAKKVRLAYRLDINEFRGNQNLQLLVEGLEAID